MRKSSDNTKEAENLLDRLRKTVESSFSKPKVSLSANVPITLSTCTSNKIDEESKGSNLEKKFLPYVLTQFENMLSADIVDLNELRRMSWNGIPSKFRPDVWKMLLGYLPLKKERRDEALKKKRKEYLDVRPLYFCASEEIDRTTIEGEIRRQIQVDLPRTCPSVPFFHQQLVRKSMERILFIWSIRHPASGYVQGMNDLLTPMLMICAEAFVSEANRCNFCSLDSEIIDCIEADAYWCFSKLMEDIQDHYTFSQPGLQRMVARLEGLTQRIDSELHNHLIEEGLQYVQFSFRWMNCAFVRELPFHALIRLWDTYLSEEKGGFENFHVYVCVVLLKTFKSRLMTMQFQDILMFLQELPTSSWTEAEIEPILSQAYILSNLFEHSPSHLT